MNCVSCLLCLLVYEIESSISDDLFLLGSTVDLASILRKNLLTNNDDFTPPTRPTINYRRSQYLPSVDMLDIIKKITGETKKPFDGIIFPKQEDKTIDTLNSHGIVPTTTNTPMSSLIRSVKTTFSGYFPKISVVQGAWRRNMINRKTKTTKKPLRKSDYLKPNKLVVDREIFEFPNITKVPTTKKNTKDSISIFYESVTAPSKTTPKKVVETTQRSVSYSGLPQQWLNKLQEDAWKRKVGPVNKLTTHNNLVIDEYNLLQYYKPFTGQKFEEMQAFMATKFFQFENKPRDHIGRIVPVTTKTTKAISISTEDSGEGEPNAQLLDMAHAKGDKVAAARRRHRVCDRNVLFPEGPKYDDHGRIIVGAHDSDKDYASTKMPKYVVPRCCNCCKKSVLGCE